MPWSAMLIAVPPGESDPGIDPFASAAPPGPGGLPHDTRLRVSLASAGRTASEIAGSDVRERRIPVGLDADGANEARERSPAFPTKGGPLVLQRPLVASPPHAPVPGGASPARPTPRQKRSR